MFVNVCEEQDFFYLHLRHSCDGGIVSSTKIYTWFQRITSQACIWGTEYKCSCSNQTRCNNNIDTRASGAYRDLWTNGTWHRPPGAAALVRDITRRCTCRPVHRIYIARTRWAGQERSKRHRWPINTFRAFPYPPRFNPIFEWTRECSSAPPEGIILIF